MPNPPNVPPPPPHPLFPHQQPPGAAGPPPPYPPIPPPRPLFKPGFLNGLKANTAFKLLFVAILAVLLFIPLGQINALRAERHARQQGAVADITKAWGGSQVFVGPVLALPYTVASTAPGRADATTEYAYFLPDSLVINGGIKPEIRYRGIYQAILYQAELDISGKFSLPDVSLLGIDPQKVLWDKAELTASVSDLRGVKEDLKLRWGQTNEIPFTPGSLVPGHSSGLRAKVRVVPGEANSSEAAALGTPIEFKFSLPMNGSQSFRVAPLGKETLVELSSPWKDPSFQGNILPEVRNITEDGFHAAWRMTWYGRDMPQQWSDSNKGRFSTDALNATLFGVDLAFPVDHYRLVERAIKYGFLFITLAFTAFFLFEILGRKRIHPFQYALIGGALCLFYLALLALSEVASFDAAYLAGAVAAVFLVTFYCTGVLGGLRNGMKAGVVLALVYGYLFVVLKLQDWSLVAGTAGVFVALLLLMAVTRRIDWYARDAEEARTAEK